MYHLGNLTELEIRVNALSNDASPCSILTRFLAMLSSQAVTKIAIEFSHYWTVLPLCPSDGQFFLISDKGLQISQRHAIKHL